jgi:serine/threonine protein kinase
MSEITIMKKLEHPNIIKLHEIINDPEWHKIYMILDFCHKGSILDWSDEKLVFSTKLYENHIPEEELVRIVGQTILGLEYLHKNNIVHRDIKPQNILQSEDGTIKLADFDVAAEITKDVVLNKTKGTLHFMSPELCKKNTKIEEWQIGYFADIWALGISLYCMVYLKLPFFDHSMVGLINAIESKEHLHYPKQREISKDLKDIIDRMLEKDPKKRITLKEIKAHPFLKKFSFPN